MGKIEKAGGRNPARRPPAFSILPTNREPGEGRKRQYPVVIYLYFAEKVLDACVPRARGLMGRKGPASLIPNLFSTDKYVKCKCKVNTAC